MNDEAAANNLPAKRKRGHDTAVASMPALSDGNDETLPLEDVQGATARCARRAASTKADSKRRAALAEAEINLVEEEQDL